LIKAIANELRLYTGVTFCSERRLAVMARLLDRAERDELLELYSELHLACGRAAAALRLASKWDATEDELLSRFRDEEERAARIWERIVQLRGN
jgi:hypothetical protein